jgi:hypothetical protein
VLRRYAHPYAPRNRNGISQNSSPLGPMREKLPSQREGNLLCLCIRNRSRGVISVPLARQSVECQERAALTLWHDQVCHQLQPPLHLPFRASLSLWVRVAARLSISVHWDTNSVSTLFRFHHGQGSPEFAETSANLICIFQTNSEEFRKPVILQRVEFCRGRWVYGRLTAFRRRRRSSGSDERRWTRVCDDVKRAQDWLFDLPGQSDASLGCPCLNTSNRSEIEQNRKIPDQN